MKTPAVQVLLAVRNSSRFLRGQLDSLLAQDMPDFEILIRDGGSADDTMEIVAEYRRKSPEKIKLLGSGTASAVENFSSLLAASAAPLVMFCDHDDVWKPDKIRVTVQKYRELERRFGGDTPILIFTDSEVVDENLGPLSPSMFRFQHLDASRLELNRLIVQNIPYGNTMLLNRALADAAAPIPPEAVMHDHWIALTAAALGRIGFLDAPTLLYRQHGGNVYGAFRYSPAAMLAKMRRGRRQLRERFEENIRQAAEFGRRYGARLPERERGMLEGLAHWDDLGFWGRRQLLWKYRIFKCGFLRNLGTFFII